MGQMFTLMYSGQSGEQGRRTPTYSGRTPTEYEWFSFSICRFPTTAPRCIAVDGLTETSPPPPLTAAPYGERPVYEQYPTVPYTTVPYPTVPYPTVPYPTLPTQQPPGQEQGCQGLLYGKPTANGESTTVQATTLQSSTVQSTARLPPPPPRRGGGGGGGCAVGGRTARSATVRYRTVKYGTLHSD